MTTETTTIASDAAVVRGGFAAFASGDVAGFANMFAPGATWNHRNDDRLGGVHEGVDAIMTFIGESAQLTAGTLRAEPLGMMSDGQGNVAVRVQVSATRPDGRAFDDPQLLLFRVDSDLVTAVDQYVGDPAAVRAFWA